MSVGLKVPDPCTNSPICNKTRQLQHATTDNTNIPKVCT